MIWGGCKNFRGNTKACVNNFILYPGCSSRSSGDYLCQTDDSQDYANSHFAGNQCVVNEGTTYNAHVCNKPFNGTYYHTANNQFFTTNGDWQWPTCNMTTLAAWQAAGEDIGSTVNTVPGVDDLLKMANARLVQ